MLYKEAIAYQDHFSCAVRALDGRRSNDGNDVDVLSLNASMAFGYF